MRQDTERTGQQQQAAYEGGSGSPLVLLHGLTGTWHVWKPILPLLEAHHRVIALTLPGHHGGPRLAHGTEPTIPGLVEAVIASLESRGIERAHFAGNSLGGWLALEMARHGRAISVVALSPAGSWSTQKEYEGLAKPFRQISLLMPFLFIFIFLLSWLRTVRRALLRQTMEHGDRIPIGDFFYSLFAFMKTAVLLPLLKSMARDGSIVPLRSSTTPIRIAWSGRDRVVPLLPFGKAMFERFPQAEHQVIEGVGHVPMYDAPERVAQAILQVTAAADVTSENGKANRE